MVTLRSLGTNRAMSQLLIRSQHRRPFPQAGRPGGVRAPAARKSFVPTLICLAIVLPFSAAVYFGAAKLTLIKILLVIFTGPAVTKIIASPMRYPRRLMISDLFALISSLIILVVPIIAYGGETIVQSVSQFIELFGSYIIGRAYFYSDDALEDFVKAIKFITIVIVGLGVADIVLQQYLAHEIAEAIFRADAPTVDAADPHFHRLILGRYSLRAASTFDHPILFGTFCALLIPIHLYAQESANARLFYVLVCAVGCVVALSSAPLLALTAAIGIYCYDAVMYSYRGRWKVMIFSLLFGVAALFVLAENPLSWVFRNLTLDPQTSYYRLLIWNAGIEQVSNNFWIGIGPNQTGDSILDTSVDSLWLGKAIVYGVPMIVALFLMGFAAVLSFPGQAGVRRADPFLDRMCTAFSLLIALLFFVSFTVYFWNAAWIFAALCVGIRVSLKERCLAAHRQRRQLG